MNLPLAVLHGDEGNAMIGYHDKVRYDWCAAQEFPDEMTPVIQEALLIAGDDFHGWLQDICEDRGWFPWALGLEAIKIRAEYGHLSIKVLEKKTHLPMSKSVEHLSLPEALLRYSGVNTALLSELHEAWSTGRLEVALPSQPSSLLEQLTLFQWLVKHYHEPIEQVGGIPKMVSVSFLFRIVCRCVLMRIP